MTTVTYDIEAMPFPLHPYQQDLVTAMTTGGFKAGEMSIISSGRQIGKSHFHKLYLAMMQMKDVPNTIQWTRHDKHPLSLVATTKRPDDLDFINFLTEEDMVAVADWCNECNCGKRTSFDTIRFKDEKQITMFLMKWSS